MGSENGVKSLESILGEDGESTEMSSWGELEDVESTDMAGINTRQVSSGLLNVGGIVTIDDEWTLSHDVS